MLSRSCSAGSLVFPPHSETLRGAAEAEFSPLIWTSWKLVRKFPSSAIFTPRCLNLKDGGFETKVPGPQRFRRAQSENNLVHSVKTMEATTHGITKGQQPKTPMCSKTGELVLAADDPLRLGMMVSYPDLDEVTEDESDDLEVSNNPTKDPVPNYHLRLAENSIANIQVPSEILHGLLKSYYGSNYRVSNEERSIMQPPYMNLATADCVKDENQSISRRITGDSAMADGEIYSHVGVASNGVALVCRTRGSKPGHLSKTELEDGFGMGKGGGKGMPGGGGEGSSGSDFNNTEIYYQKMLEANPGNPLLLRNYAKFLHEVQHDTRRAEEYYERAILASPGDGDVLCLYAKLIWEGHQDPSRAKAYFDQAVQVAPNDCYVLASYAHFLWNSIDEEEDDNDPDPQYNAPGQRFVESASALSS